MSESNFDQLSKANQNEILESLFGLKKSIIAISAILNSYPSATLSFRVDDFVKRFPSATLRYIAGEIQRAISPQITVAHEAEKIAESSSSQKDAGVLRFTVTGGNPPYAAYGQYYTRKNGEICPSENEKYIFPEMLKNPAVNIGPKTKQTEYIETFADLRYGLRSLTAIRNLYPCAVLYIGVTDDGTVIDPRSVEETEGDITEAVREYVEQYFSENCFFETAKAIFNVDKIGELGVAQLILVDRYHSTFLDYGDDYNNLFDTYVRDNFVVRRYNRRDHMQSILTQFSLYELESPARELSFKHLKELLDDNGIQWNDFATEMGVSLSNNDGLYNWFAYLMSDAMEPYICTPHIYVHNLKRRVHKYFQLWDHKECWFMERIGNILNHIQTLNRSWAKRIDGVKVNFQFFNFEDAKAAYLCACIYHDWASPHSPAIEELKTSLDIYCLPVLHKDADGELVPKKNEVLARLMKMYGLIDDADLSLSRLQEKLGPKSIVYVKGGEDKYMRIIVPGRVRV